MGIWGSVTHASTNELYYIRFFAIKKIISIRSFVSCMMASHNANSRSACMWPLALSRWALVVLDPPGCHCPWIMASPSNPTIGDGGPTVIERWLLGIEFVSKVVGLPVDYASNSERVVARAWLINFALDFGCNLLVFAILAAKMSQYHTPIASRKHCTIRRKIIAK